MEIIINAIEQGLLFALVAIGVYITYKILDFPDLSVDGTFPLGAAISAALLVKGVNPWITILVATIGGAIAGSITGFLHVKLKISNLMSGILVMIGLYSINLRIMGKANTPLFSTNHIFKNTSINSIFIILAIVIVVKALLDLFLKTKAGFLLVAVGDNEQVVSALGINKNIIKVMGLMISNGLVALAGALTAQHQGFADVIMGQGTVVMGLAAVIIGVSIFGKISFVKATTLSILGAIIYKLVVAIALWMRLNPNDLKLMTAIIVVIALASNNDIFKIKRKKNKIKEVVGKGGDEDVKNSGAIQSIQS
ncbi:ABC transporter permease [Clostridium celatum]|uniref:Branched-chain amino acid ABC transporter, permease protein n=1 Tax=Clostridium celatum DSM 1785 TaxID=545697 RepID=L1QEJ4_9CLOT|nr:branched-chain amino acid ABC transporter permease [Clostridium celatum]EKY26346.1 branched-chain amino acid ABC transporter, permease protein [Clostridium celatum DSM 1785]MCE9655798.1 ABC transporter permease [Clostridium celatum]MDU2265887.1 ABC transporter permease [Clostridium celatum]MDU3724021.1 ABC transporter permease [Clostridium celatum]MDU6294261.1 ABC transporter permease [Clostridium celatum]